ncbi:hypothetical protein FSAG_003074 [Fusobacterium periodonticum 2_1_31]|uniref:Uncharacterized protein n=1 Tax=Fusobacterium periodonticum 2_1_31 TaxID=469599 RepID=A0ABR4WN78_9FUSO|nr:hypothetical protein FSAG_003074 [Fusobacterium periodonticum 2_1_31]
MRFRPLAEYHSFLLSELKEMVKNNGGLFPSPYRVSFILIGNNIRIINSHIFKEKFPSPYGVLFILMNSNFLFQDLRFGKGFPSPYGVSFILIKNIKFYGGKNEYKVSVSLRSIIHSY